MQLDVYARLTEAQLRNRLDPDNALFIVESPKGNFRLIEDFVFDKINLTSSFFTITSSLKKQAPTVVGAYFTAVRYGAMLRRSRELLQGLFSFPASVSAR